MTIRPTLLASIAAAGLIFVGCTADADKKERHAGGPHGTLVEKKKEKAKEAESSKEEEIPVNAVPAVVMEGFRKAYPNVTITEVERETYADGTVHYEFEFTDARSVKRDVEFNDQGEVLEDHE
jgi:hypothetical protein